ncbi:hypothetical protein ACHWQZ_G011564 [Mnemiopsis leidyi]
MMYLSSVESQSATELRHTAATISYAGQLLLGPPHGTYETKTPVHGHSFAAVADLQSMYDLQMEQRCTAYRRATHKLSEQKRRKILNSRFDDLRTIIPACQDGAHSKMSVLKKAMNYIDQLTKELMVQEHVLRELQQEQERRRLLQQEHSQWSNKIHNLRKHYRIPEP